MKTRSMVAVTGEAGDSAGQVCRSKRQRMPVGRLLGTLALLALLSLPAAARAEDGYELWLRYRPLTAEHAEAYRAHVSGLIAASATPTQAAARTELLRGLEGLLGAAPPWDDCFLNTAPVSLYRAGQRLRLTSDCDRWIVYDAPAHATCVEPQTGPPDAFNLETFVLAPGASLTTWFLLEWSRTGAALSG